MGYWNVMNKTISFPYFKPNRCLSYYFEKRCAVEKINNGCNLKLQLVLIFSKAQNFTVWHLKVLLMGQGRERGIIPVGREFLIFSLRQIN